MRQLNGDDVFAALRFISELGLEEQVKLVAMAKDGLTQKERGVSFIFRVLGKCGTKQAAECFWEMISGPLEMPPEELRKMEPLKLVETLKGLDAVIDKEAYKDFFKSLVGTLM